MTISRGSGWKRYALLGATVSAAGGIWHCSSRDASRPPAEEPSVIDRILGVQKRVDSQEWLAPLRDIETLAGTLKRTTLTDLRRALGSRDADSFARSFAPGATWPDLGGAARSVKREVGGLRELAWTPSGLGGTEDLTAYLQGWSSVASVELELVALKPAGEAAEGTIAFDLRGVDAAGVRRQDRGRLSARFARKDGRWLIAGLSASGPVETIVAVAGRKPAFEDTTASSGLTVPQVDRREALRRGGYALAVADMDHDGRSDVLVGNWGPVQLFRNTGERFEDVTAKSGLQGETLVKSAAFADLDGDKLSDIVLVRFVDSAEAPSEGSDPNEGRPGAGDVVVYRNLGDGRFERKGDVLMRNHVYDRAMPLAIADFDGNGTLDLYVGFPGARDFTNDLSNSGGSKDKLHQGLWLNDGKWGFIEKPAALTGTAPDAIFPHAVLATDFTGDARPELLVVDDSGHPSPLYRNDGKGNLAQIPKDQSLDVAAWAMGASAADFDGDGANDLVMTSIMLGGGLRLEQWMASQASVPEVVKLKNNLATRGMFLLRNDGRGKFEDVTAQSGLAWAGAAPAGAEWFDYDNDGRLDLYVANGLWTGGEEDAEPFFNLIVHDRTYREKHLTDLAMSLPGVTGPAANPVLQILREFRGTLADPKAPPTSDKPTLSLAGHQRNRLFRNNGDGTFTDVAWLENADRIEDGYVMAPADLDGDGDQDLVLRNCDPAPGISFPVVVELRNTGIGGRSLTVSLEGAGKNPDGIGARVTARIGGKSLTREIRSVNGASQTEAVAFFGLGTNERVDGLSVLWPSGRVEQFPGAAAGRTVLREGAGKAAAQ